MSLNIFKTLINDIIVHHSNCSLYYWTQGVSNISLLILVLIQLSALHTYIILFNPQNNLSLGEFPQFL